MKLRTLPLLCSAVFALAACAGEPGADTATPTPSPTAAARVAGTGTIDTAAGAYRFQPTTCAIHVADGVPDLEIGGAGTAPDGQPIYVELSSTANALDISLGVDKPFASSDKRVQAGNRTGEKLKIEVEGKTVTIASLTLMDDDGQAQQGSLRIECG